MTFLQDTDHCDDMLTLKTYACVMLTVFLALSSSPSKSLAPPPIYPRDYIGPYVACRPGIAVSVNVGEKLHVIGGTDMFDLLEGRLIVGAFVQDPVRDTDIVHFRGISKVSDLGQVTRYELTSRNSDSREIGYVYDTGKPYFTGHYRALFRSAQFTGTDSDKPLLARIVSGAKADAMCPRQGE